MSQAKPSNSDSDISRIDRSAQLRHEVAAYANLLAENKAKRELAQRANAATVHIMERPVYMPQRRVRINPRWAAEVAKLQQPAPLCDYPTAELEPVQAAERFKTARTVGVWAAAALLVAVLSGLVAGVADKKLTQWQAERQRMDMAVGGGVGEATASGATVMPEGE